MLKRFIIAAVLLVVLAGGLIGFNLFRDQMIAQFLANRPVQSMPVETIEVQPETWSPVLNAIGTVNAAQGVELTVEAAGIVREIGFSSNAEVMQGDILLRLDDEVQRADLNATQSQLALERLNLDRALELQSRGVTANVQLDQTRAAFDVATAQMARAEAVIQQRRLVAPFAGVIGLPRVDAGQHITPGTVVATLQELDQMRVDFSLPEQALPALHIGQALDIRVQGDDRRFRGEISGIDPRVDPNSRMVAVRGTVENPGRSLTPGQFARVEIRLPQEDGVIALPQNAVVTSLYGDFAYVVRPSEEDADQLVVRQTFVTTGRRNNGVVEIVEGIADGDRVVSAGQNRLSNRAPVTLAETTTPEVAQ
ncbi:efflux RND transporter periplasmic adaptor subunit [Roseinatronobacter alkalisoli]|uniref:Efflux RND transporter periplasmic adaptor subunit n=1 Tax=Roseinatronobacter alkalisoli TaxID=3028235 RepID=A0ABT5TE11_9RHOB|nr:efflux RND transporter periplasmic adaptor subunit [Roseinatronobacter sp. HJB301]MDD7972407.1 efflux RND transporter periplasmic adaptor subunit [Roseinatronobacter sp. HJB301]